MNEFVIVSDSTVDLPKEYLQSKQVPIISLSYIMDGVTSVSYTHLTLPTT